MVRSSFVARQSSVSPEQAQKLLTIRIARGPILVQREPGDVKFTHWVPVPSDAALSAVEQGQVGETGQMLLRAKVFALADGEGVLWPEGTPDDLQLVKLPTRDGKGNKTSRLVDQLPFWPLKTAVKWAVGNDATVSFPNLFVREPKSEGTDVLRMPLVTEGRVHVAIDEASQTAEPGMLYNTPGIRFAKGFGIAVEVEAPSDFNWPEHESSVQLGGEGRPSYRSRQDSAAFPEFEVFKRLYMEAAHKPCPPAGLRLELLTPAWLHDGAPTGAPAWLPSWLREPQRTAQSTPTTVELPKGHHPNLPKGMNLELVAACLPGFAPISGWNMQGGKDGHGAPRAVRRLTPAGTVYYFRLRRVDGRDVGAEELINAACVLWAVPLEPEPNFARELVSNVNLANTDKIRDGFLAPPARDGFGLVLPGFWWEDSKGPVSPGGTQ
jgi:hypothetical protein